MFEDQARDPDETLALFAAGPDQLETVLQGLTGSDLDLALTEDSWTIRQIVHHLADGDDIWKTCIKAALGNETGLFTLQWYWEKPQTGWAENWHYAGREIDTSIALFRANRGHITELIRHTREAWQKSIRIQWPQGEARITVGEVICMQADHHVGHVNDIRTIRQAHNR